MNFALTLTLPDGAATVEELRHAIQEALLQLVMPNGETLYLSHDAVEVDVASPAPRHRAPKTNVADVQAGIKAAVLDILSRHPRLSAEQLLVEAIKAGAKESVSDAISKGVFEDGAKS